ncbi:MAG: hypothetical protein AB1646_00495 [Thermodesulfobacteriota bacterium]
MARLLILCVLSLTLSGGNPGLAFQLDRINPYVPHNALAAQPETPYNIDEMDKYGTRYYEPCPRCAAGGMDLPEHPPVWVPFPGPFGVPVSVP